MNVWWDALERRARIGLLAGAAAIALATLVAGWWLLRVESAVLFSDLKPEDAAVMAAELDRQKVPYTVADAGTTLLVDKTHVHATRLKLMGKDLPLHGAVGLELFNNAEFGMTEFAQKINYQRALHGRLAAQDPHVHPGGWLEPRAQGTGRLVPLTWPWSAPPLHVPGQARPSSGNGCACMAASRRARSP
ncbi:hypothetical protein [Ramlibacter sp.]|jgi:hypothetical protein|uniref:hypothetical protein n=1 Tax=Ramlibacter sp. TaxID=1917967 RepID=UPI003BEEBC2D